MKIQQKILLSFLAASLVVINFNGASAQTQIPSLEDTSIPQTKDKKVDPFDVTITGESGLEIPIIKDPPSLQLPFPPYTHPFLGQ